MSFHLHILSLHGKTGKKMPQNPDLEMSLFSLCPCWRKAFMRRNAYRQQAHRDQDPPKSRPGTWEAKVHLLPGGLEIFHVFEGSSFPKLGLVSLKRGGIGDWLTHSPEPTLNCWASLLAGPLWAGEKSSQSLCFRAVPLPWISDSCGWFVLCNFLRSSDSSGPMKGGGRGSVCLPHGSGQGGGRVFVAVVSEGNIPEPRWEVPYCLQLSGALNAALYRTSLYGVWTHGTEDKLSCLRVGWPRYSAGQMDVEAESLAPGS